MWLSRLWLQNSSSASLQRVKTHQTSVHNMTLNNQMVNLQ